MQKHVHVHRLTVAENVANFDKTWPTEAVLLDGVSDVPAIFARNDIRQPHIPKLIAAVPVFVYRGLIDLQERERLGVDNQHRLGTVFK